MRKYFDAFFNPRTRPTCLIAGAALLLLSLIYCGGLAAIVMIDRDPETGQLRPRWERRPRPTPTVVATPAPSSRLLPPPLIYPLPF